METWRTIQVIQTFSIFAISFSRTNYNHVDLVGVLSTLIDMLKMGACKKDTRNHSRDGEDQQRHHDKPWRGRTTDAVLKL